MAAHILLLIITQAKMAPAWTQLEGQEQRRPPEDDGDDRDQLRRRARETDREVASLRAELARLRANAPHGGNTASPKGLRGGGRAAAIAVKKAGDVKVIDGDGRAIMLRRAALTIVAVAGLFLLVVMGTRASPSFGGTLAQPPPAATTPIVATKEGWGDSVAFAAHAVARRPTFAPTSQQPNTAAAAAALAGAEHTHEPVAAAAPRNSNGDCRCDAFLPRSSSSSASAAAAAATLQVPPPGPNDDALTILLRNEARAKKMAKSAARTKQSGKELPAFAILRSDSHVGSYWITELLASYGVSMFFETDGHCGGPGEPTLQPQVSEAGLKFMLHAGCRCWMPQHRPVLEEMYFCSEPGKTPLHKEFDAGCRNRPARQCRGIGLMAVGPIQYPTGGHALLPWTCATTGGLDSDCSACWCADAVPVENFCAEHLI